MPAPGLSVKVTPTQLSMRPGETGRVQIDVTNQTRLVEEAVLVVEGIDPSWYQVANSRTRLMPGRSGRLTLTISPPPGRTTRAGTHTVRLRVYLVSSPRAFTQDTLRLEVASVGGFEMQVVPNRIVTQGPGRFRVELTNLSNGPRRVVLNVTDPADELMAELSAAQIHLPPNSRRDVQLTMKRKLSPKVKATPSVRFSVVARSPDPPVGDQLGRAEGEYQSLPPYAFLGAAARRTLKLAPWVIGAGVLLIGFLWYTQKPVVAAPTIKYFRLTVPDDVPAGKVKLEWDVDGSKLVTLDGNNVQEDSSTTVEVGANKTYVLVASSDGGTTRKQIGLVAIQPPDVLSITASPEAVAPGGKTTLRWQTVRAEKAALDGTPVPLRDGAGAVEVSPTDQKRRFTLTVENRAGKASETVDVEVRAR